MSDPLTSVSQALELLVPSFEEDRDDWEQIVTRARLDTADVPSEAPRRLAGVEEKAAYRGLLRRARRRPLLVLLLVVVLVAIPVSALAVTNTSPWWFLSKDNLVPSENQPASPADVVVVKTGTWNGQGWAFTAYRSRIGSLCIDFTETANGQPPASLRSVGGGGTCSPMIGTGVPRGQAHPPSGIISLSGIPDGRQAAKGVHYLIGAVVDSATTVVIHLGDSSIIRTKAFSAPKALGLNVRFFAAQLPLAPIPSAGHPSCQQRVVEFEKVAPVEVTGLDSSGKVVANRRREKSDAAGFFCHRPMVGTLTGIPAAAMAKAKPVLHVVAPYGATATVSVGKPIRMQSSRLLPNGTRKRSNPLNRCWKVTFSNGQAQGTCTPETKLLNPDYWFSIQHAGHDTFVTAQAWPRKGPAITRIALELADGEVLSAKPIDGIVVFAIPRAGMSMTKSQRAFLVGYDRNGHQVSYYNGTANVTFNRQPVYYRSCPNLSAKGGGGC
jgi:hypothetical protein